MDFSFFASPRAKTLVGNMSGAREPGSTRRRRERRLRSILRHERQTVAMELAAALHHSGGGREKYVGRRARKTASSGTRPRVLKDPGARWVDAALSHRAACAPSVAMPSLTDAGGEAVDRGPFLALKEEKRRMREVNRKVLYGQPCTEAEMEYWR